MPEDLSDYAARALTRMGVDVRTSTRVTDCDAGGVDLEHGRIDAGTIIWAAGVVASPAARWLDAEHDRAGRVLVRPDLSVPGQPDVFVIGDAAAVSGQSGATGARRGAAPPSRWALYVGRLIAARVAGRSLPPPFRYRHLGDLATIGRRAAVVKFGRLHLTGFVGWLFWSVAHIYFLIGVQQPFHRRVHLAVGLHHVPARRAADHRGAAGRRRRSSARGLCSAQLPLNQL